MDDKDYVPGRSDADYDRRSDTEYNLSIEQARIEQSGLMRPGSASRRHPRPGGLSDSVILLVVTGVIAGIALMLVGTCQ
jgi:hypothetical protein